MHFTSQAAAHPSLDQSPFCPAPPTSSSHTANDTQMTPFVHLTRLHQTLPLCWLLSLLFDNLRGRASALTQSRRFVFTKSWGAGRKPLAWDKVPHA